MPTAITIPDRDRRRQGIKLGCCRVCTCLHLQFLTSKCGLLKIFELLLGSCCETLMVRFGMAAVNDLGESLYSFHSTVASCMLTTLVLTISYVLSFKTYTLIRQSIFEVIFNSMCCLIYISASTYLGYATNVWLYPRYTTNAADVAFPAMTCAYYVGTILAIVYGMDAFVAYKDYKGIP